MATIPVTVYQSGQRFLVAMRQRVQAAYLYGSQVKGTAAEWSDIDVAVVSPDFSADLFQERLMLMRLAAQPLRLWRVTTQPSNSKSFTTF